MATKDALQILTDDHRTVEDLFKRFSEAGDRAHKTKKQLVERLIKELSIHAAVEEQVLYPLARELDKKVDEQVLESLEEHHVAKVALAELDGMEPTDERYDAKVAVLAESINHHVEEEESELFPMIRERVDNDDLREMGRVIQEAKKVAPTRAHPHAPDEPPGNVANLFAGLVDRVRDRVRAA